MPKAKRISIILTIVALGLWSYSLTQIKYDVGLFGLIHSFPITFFVALGVLTIASAILWVSPENHSKLLFLQLAPLIVSIYFGPLIAGSNQGLTFSLWNSGIAEYVVREGHFNQHLFLYHNWPGFEALLAMLTLTVGLPSPYALIVNHFLTSFILQLLFLLFVYLFLKNILGESKKNLLWAGLWIFLLGNWVGLDSMAPSGMGYLLFLMMLALLTPKSPLAQGSRLVGNRVLNILTLTCATVTHLLTSFIILATAAMLQLTKRINAWTLVTLGAVLILAWLLYHATSFFDSRVVMFINEALRLDILFQKAVVERVAGSESRQVVSQIRILFTLLVFAIGFLGFVFSRRSKKSIYADNTVLAIAMGAVMITSVLSFGAGKELPERFFAFTLPVIAYFGVKLLNRKSTAIILCLLLLVALPLHFVSRWGAEMMELYPPRSQVASHFFFDHTREGVIAGGDFPRYERVEKYPSYPFGRLLEVGALLPGYEPGWRDIPHPQYVIFGPSMRSRAYYLHNDTYIIDYVQDLLEYSNNHNLIYVNSGVSIYSRNRN